MTELPQRHFKGIWIPAEIWEHPELSWLDKTLAAEIDSLDGPDGCFASNEYFEKFFGLQKRQIQNSLAKLKKLGIIQEIKYDGRIRYLRGYSKLKAIAHQTCNENAHQTCKKMHVSHAEKCTSPVKPYIYDNKEDNKDKNIAQSPAKRGHEQRSDFFFDHEKKDFSGITEKDLEEWKILYPHLDIPSEVLRAKQWLLANPTKANKKLWRKYLTSWFQRNNDHQENKKAYRSSLKPEEKKAPNLEFLKEILKRNNAWTFIRPPNNDDLIKVKIDNDWIKISTYENALEDQVMNALYKGGHL